MKDNKKINKAIILSSGGLDSTYNAIAANQEFDELVLLFFDYGQKAMSQEFIAVKKLSQLLNAKFIRYSLPFYKELKSSLTSVKEAVTEYSSLETLIELENDKLNFVPAEWVPNRNAVFTMAAGAVAESMDIQNVVIGINKEEAGRYPDNSLKFLNKANDLLKISTIKDVFVKSYSIDLNKEQIYNNLLKLGVSLGINNTSLKDYIWSCYYSNHKMCGLCESCLRLKNVVGKEWEDRFLM